jgi:hypothetical protein
LLARAQVFIASMPQIYQIIREERSHGNQLPKGAAGAVLHGQEDEGELVSVYLAMFRDGQWIAIRHPIEESDLKQNGETFESARAKGILFLISPHLCLTCGSTVEIPDMRYGLAGGCLGPLFVGIALAIGLVVTQALSPALSAYAGLLGMVFASLIWAVCADLVKRRKFPEILKAVAKDACGHCGGRELRNVGKFGRKKVVLRNGKSIQVRIVGMS